MPRAATAPPSRPSLQDLRPPVSRDARSVRGNSWLGRSSTAGNLAKIRDRLTFRARFSKAGICALWCRSVSLRVWASGADATRRDARRGVAGAWSFSRGVARMGLSLWTLLQAALLFTNAFAILNEDRFLKKRESFCLKGLARKGAHFPATRDDSTRDGRTAY